MPLKYNWKKGPRNIALVSLIGLAGFNYCSDDESIQNNTMTIEQYQTKQIDYCKKEQGFTPTYTVQAGDSYERIAQGLDYCFAGMRGTGERIPYKDSLRTKLYKTSGVNGTDLHPGDELMLDLSDMEW